MTVRLRLDDGVYFDVDADLPTFTEWVESALQGGRVVPIKNPETGKVRMVNPFQILYFEEREEEPGG